MLNLFPQKPKVKPSPNKITTHKKLYWTLGQISAHTW